MTRGLALVLVAALGCGGGGAGAPAAEEPATADEPALMVAEPDALVAAVDRALRLFEELADAAEQAGGDCDAMVAALEAVADGPDGDAIRQVDTVHAEAYTAREAELDDRFAARMSAAAARLGTAISPCSDNPGIIMALDQAGLGG